MKQIQLQAPRVAIELLSHILEIYTHAAYPPGGSECAQSAREALLTLTHTLRTDYDERTGSVLISRRMKTQIKSAIEYYPQTLETPDAQISTHTQQLLACLNGEALSEGLWNGTAE